MTKKLLAIALSSLCMLAIAAPSHAQHRRGSSAPAGPSVSVPRSGGGVAASPRVYAAPSYRSYYYPRSSFGFYIGSPYYSPYYYPYGYYNSPYGYGGYAPYGYGGSYVVAGGGRDYGSVRIADAPKDAQVYADGYYAGTADDFDGAFKHLNLDPGTHHIEVRVQGQAPLAVDVNIRPGETITYHAK